MTATDETSEVVAKADILSLTPLPAEADQTWPPSRILTGTNKEGINQPFDKTSPISINLAGANVSSNNVSQSPNKKLSESRNVAVANSSSHNNKRAKKQSSVGSRNKCSHCGSMKLKLAAKPPMYG